MKTAAIKRACKWHFRKVTSLKEIIHYDDQITIEKAVSNSPNVVDNLNEQITLEQKC
jgi:hypothetical protein